MIEKAVFISRADRIKYVTSEYKRLYFGNEFCQELIPCDKDLNKILEFISERKMDFTYVTPFLTDSGMERIKSVLNLLSHNVKQAEIVINDWGLLRFIKRNYNQFNLALGRLLTKQKRGPRILNLKGKVPESMIAHFRSSNVDTAVLSDFLTGHGIRRVELDNLLQGIERKSSLKASLYYPFVYVTTTRYCLSNIKNFDSVFQRRINPCSFECQKYTFKLEHKSMPACLFLKGNTQFFRNDTSPPDLEKLNIDRLVYQPEIPF